MPRESWLSVNAEDAPTSYLLNRGCLSNEAAAMDPLPPPLAFLPLLFSVWVNRQQQAVIDYLLEENRCSPQELLPASRSRIVHIPD